MSASSWQNLPNKAATHPFLARFLIFVFVITLDLGVIHEFRLAGEVLIVRYTKHELTQLADVASRLKRELTMWDLDREEKKPENSSTKSASRGP